MKDETNRPEVDAVAMHDFETQQTHLMLLEGAAMSPFDTSFADSLEVERREAELQEMNRAKEDAIRQATDDLFNAVDAMDSILMGYIDHPDARKAKAALKTLVDFGVL